MVEREIKDNLDLAILEILDWVLPVVAVVEEAAVVRAAAAPHIKIPEKMGVMVTQEIKVVAVKVVAVEVVVDMVEVVLVVLVAVVVKVIKVLDKLVKAEITQEVAAAVSQDNQEVLARGRVEIL